MTVGVPRPSIGAEWPLGFAVQSALGTPVPVPATAGNWINTRDNTLTCVTGEHMIKTALGTRATEQESAQQEIHVEGGFGANLRTTTARTLLEAFFGHGSTSGSTRTLSVTKPQLLTIFDNWSNEEHQYQDCMLNTMTLQSQTHAEWQLNFTVMGGLTTLVDSGVPTFDPTDHTFAWADVTGLTGLDVVPCQVSQWTVNFGNGVKVDYGAGSRSFCAIVGGEFTITGTAMVRYDDANASSVESAYRAGTDLGPTVLTLTDPAVGANVHTLTFPNITILTFAKQAPLDDYIRANVTWGVKHAEQFTWALPA
jgi:hypothetical protein